jgi:hypothetical protein
MLARAPCKAGDGSPTNSDARPAKHRDRDHAVAVGKPRRGYVPRRERRSPLVELYTSEGCDSCPAADRWLSSHLPAGRGNDAIALAFHVDYWDRLGWKDRFATPEYTARQHQTMRANRATFVYTPQVVLQGRDFTAWRRGAPTSAIATASERKPRAKVALRAVDDRSTLDVEVATTLNEPLRRETQLAVAYVDSRLTSDVKAGENRGAKLTHDHVVRSFETRPLSASSSTFSMRLRKPDEAGEYPTLVAFVQEDASGDVLQAFALPLEQCR